MTNPIASRISDASMAVSAGVAGEFSVEAHLAEALPPGFIAEWAAIAVHPMSQPFVALNCWRMLCRDEGELTVFAVRRGGRLVGVAPLARSGGAVRKWTAPSHAEVGRVVFAMTEDPAAILVAVFESLRRHGCDVIEIPTVTTESPLYAGLRTAAEAAGFTFVEDLTCMVPYKSMIGGWDAFWKTINGDTRRKFGQQERRLQKLGSLDYAVWHGGEGLGGLLDECFEIEASGYKGERGTAIKFREAEGRFWRQFTADAAAAGLLWIYTLRLDGRLISYEISIKCGGVLYAMKHGTDVRVEAQAPGNALHLNIFKQEVAAGDCHTFDFAGELSEWKRRWSKDAWSMMGIRLFAPNAKGRLAYALGPVLRRGLKRVPGMMTAVSWLRGEPMAGRDACRAKATVPASADLGGSTATPSTGESGGSDNITSSS